MTLDEEKALEAYKHRKEVCRLVIDKVILTAIIGLFIFGSKWLLEDYKSDLTKQQFLLESRLDAIRDLRQIYAVLHDDLYSIAYGPKENRGQLIGDYQGHIRDFLAIGNKWGALFPDEFDRSLNYHLQIHIAVAQDMVEFTPNQWAFAIDVSRNFDAITRNALWKALDETSPIPKDVFPLEQWTHEKLQKQGPANYYNSNLQKWQAAHNRAVEQVPIPTAP